MDRHLTLVVTCTDRKSAPPHDDLRYGNLPQGGPAERLKHWQDRLSAQSARYPLRRLYQGDAWRQVLTLETKARRAGFITTLLVASAGLGLVEVEDRWPAYAATFSPRHADTVGGTRADNQLWWRLVSGNQQHLTERAVGQTLFVLSQTYAGAMAEDLKLLAGRDDVVVFGGSKDVPDHQRIPADGGLRRALGGTSNSLNLRTAIAWVERLETPTLAGHGERLGWKTWVEQNRYSDRVERKTLSDSEVRSFLTELRETRPSVSKTRALRLLRESGYACEQKRFGALFEGAAPDTGKLL